MRILGSMLGVVLALGAGLAAAHGGHDGNHDADGVRYVPHRMCHVHGGREHCHVVQVPQRWVPDRRGHGSARDFDRGRRDRRDGRRPRGRWIYDFEIPFEGVTQDNIP